MSMDKRLMADLMPLFAGLNNTELEALAGILELRSVRKKQMVVSEGEVCHDMVYVRKGLLRQFYFKNGREITEHFTCEGNIAYCIESIFKNEPSRLMMEALESSDLCLIPYAGLQHHSRQYAERDSGAGHTLIYFHTLEHFTFMRNYKYRII